MLASSSAVQTGADIFVSRLAPNPRLKHLEHLCVVALLFYSYNLPDTHWGASAHDQPCLSRELTTVSIGSGLRLTATCNIQFDIRLEKNSRLVLPYSEHMTLDWTTVPRVEEVDFATMIPEFFKEGLEKCTNV